MPLKTEADGRMFPATDSSATVVDCLLRASAAAGVKLRPGCGVEAVARRPEGGFELTLARGERLICDRLLLATGGCRTAAAGDLAVALGHTLEPPVPSLFAFRVETPWVRALAGVSVETVEVSVPAAGVRERGALLLTHQGLSGPAVLRASAWGARALHGLDYQFPLRLNWLPDLAEDADRGGVQSSAPGPAGAPGGQHAVRAADRAPVGAPRGRLRDRARHAVGGADARRASSGSSGSSCGRSFR